MKQKLFTLLFFMAATGCCYAQSGSAQISLGAETNFFLSNGYSGIYNPGFGGNIKGMYGVTDGGQVTLTTGYTYYGGKSGSLYGDQDLSLIPILAGYRFSAKSGWYGEVQAGIGMLGTHVSGSTFSQTNFAAAANVGYVYKNFDLSLRYYTEGDVISLFAIRLAYNISLGSGK